MSAAIALTAYEIGGTRMEIRPAPRTRRWMDATRERYAYRCLPLIMANQYGFELLAPADLNIEYSEGDDLDAITFTPQVPWATSHFGYGVVTFVIPYLFRTPEGIHLYVCGPANRIPYRLIPLEGIVETDHAVQTFTMNWKFNSTHCGTIILKNEPICRLFPVRAGSAFNSLRIVEHEHVPKDIMEAHTAWNESRGKFLENLKKHDLETVKAGWQRTYMKEAHYK